MTTTKLVYLGIIYANSAPSFFRKSKFDDLNYYDRYPTKLSTSASPKPRALERRRKN
jgi:hypothetical protein